MDYFAFNYRFHTVGEITPEILKEIGIDGIAVDLDNTLVFDGTFKFFEGASKWVARIIDAGIPVMIISNTTAFRAVFLARYLKVDYIAFARKPSPKAIFKAAKKLGVDVGRLGMVGDQIFADVEAANRAGAVPLLVDPVTHEFFFKKRFKEIRNKEKPILEKFDREVGYYVDKRKV